LSNARRKNHGSVLSRSTPFYIRTVRFKSDHTDGQLMVTQETRDPTIAQLGVVYASEGPLPMLITSAASTLELIFREQMQKLCQVNGNSRLVHVWGLSREII